LVQTQPKKKKKAQKRAYDLENQDESRVVRGLTQVSEGASVGVGSQWLRNWGWNSSVN
jgi:hypothetical protein